MKHILHTLNYKRTPKHNNLYNFPNSIIYMDPVKEAFSKVKQDISDLKEELEAISSELIELKQILNPTHIPTHNLNELYNMPLEAVKSPISDISTGNRGVPTDRQTNQQTDRHIISNTKSPFQASITSPPSLKQVSEVLNSLDDLKKDLRRQFKKLTSQEMLVFATIYQLEEEGLIVDYSLISTKLKLSESSIRDYALKIMRKGVPLTKIKENNKKVILSIPLELKKMASLQTLIALREI